MPDPDLRSHRRIRLVDVDGGDPLGVAPDVPAGRTGELLVDGQPVDVGADGAGGELPGPLEGGRVRRGVVVPDDETDGHLVVAVEVGVVVAADGQCHQGPARQRPVTSRPVGSTMRWAAAAGTRYWTPHWAAERTSTGRPIVRPSTCQGPWSDGVPGASSTTGGAWSLRS